MPNIKLVSNGDDWVELIIDGKRVLGNHSISASEMLQALGIEIEEIEVVGEDEYEQYLSQFSK